MSQSAFIVRVPEAEPHVAAPFVALTEALAHATDAELDVVETQLKESLARGGPVQSECREVALLEDSAGRWEELHTFPL